MSSYSGIWLLFLTGDSSGTHMPFKKDPINSFDVLFGAGVGVFVCSMIAAWYQPPYRWIMVLWSLWLCIFVFALRYAVANLHAVERENMVIKRLQDMESRIADSIASRVSEHREDLADLIANKVSGKMSLPDFDEKGEDQGDD